MDLEERQQVEEIRQHLRALLSSHLFPEGAKTTRFLKFVVETELLGLGQGISQTTIAVECFSVPANVEPDKIAFVRETAGEVRKKLAQYYQQDTSDSSNVIITIPLGQYRPKFEWQTPAELTRPSPDRNLAQGLIPDFSPPPPPHRFIERLRAVEELQTQILQGRGRRGGLIALYGMPGIGKTVLAQLICDDKAIRSEFTDGIFWFHVGRERKVDPETRSNYLAHALAQKTGVPEVSFRQIVRSKGILVVLDNVWSVEDVEAVRAVSARSAILFTTRDQDIAFRLGATTVPVHPLSPSESQELFEKWADVEGTSASLIGRQIVSEAKGAVSRILCT